MSGAAATALTPRKGFGPLPTDQVRFKGFHNAGRQVVVRWDVGGVAVDDELRKWLLVTAGFGADDDDVEAEVKWKDEGQVLDVADGTTCAADDDEVENEGVNNEQILRLITVQDD